jgi:hypothetical protein
MKKLILLATITFVLGGIVNAQTSENVVKGIHGGVVFGSENLKFEYVEKGGDVLVYPMSADGKILKAVPTSAEITIVPIAINNSENFKDVAFGEGCFKVSRINPELPIYIVYVITYLNDKMYEGKYVVPNLHVK